MKNIKYKISPVIAGVVLLGSIAGAALAQGVPPQGQGGPGISANVSVGVNGGRSGGGMYGNGQMGGGPQDRRNGSGTPSQWRNGSSTAPFSGGRMGMPGIMGIVTSVGSNSLTVDSHGRGANSATTTFSVAVSSSTTFKDGTSTGSLSDITTGARVFVSGPVSTSTDSVTANTITYGMNFNRPNAPQGSQGGGPGNTGIFQKIGTFFSGVFHDVFGWMK